MKKSTVPQFHSVGSVHTLAQSGTNDINVYPCKPNIVVQGEGTDRSQIQALKGKAKRKAITQKTTYHLVDIAKERGDKEQVQSYWNTWHCQQKVFTKNGRIYGYYCKNRFCTVCLANRKAQIINKYHPIIKTWEAPYFVTLTVKSVPARKLKFMIRKGVLRAFRQIREAQKKRYQRGTGIKLVGVKSLECNFNPIKKWYNPHLHIIVSCQEAAELLKKEWEKKWGKKYVDPRAQHIRPIRDLEHTLIETIKYGSKIFTDPDMKKGDNKVPPKVYAKALDTILCAMKGIRQFDRFGFDAPKGKIRTAKQTIITDYEQWIYDPVSYDWLDYETGEVLTGHIPSSQLRYLLNNNIDAVSY